MPSVNHFVTAGRLGALALIMAAMGALAGGLPLQLPQSGDDNIFFNGEIVGRIEVVTDAPYTATADMQNIRVLADGTRIVRKATQLVARDSKGRVRREQTMDAIGSIALNGPKIVFIIDPVSLKQYILNTKEKTVQIVKRPELIAISRPEKAETEKAAQSDKDAVNRQQELARLMNGSRQSLGEKMIEGLNVKGEIRSWTIPTGAIGNDGPIAVSVEAWYSADLHTEVIRNRIDPRFGESQYRLTNIKRAEPDPALFRIPPGYKIVTNR
jgi:hypothetical protein